VLARAFSCTPAALELALAANVFPGVTLSRVVIAGDGGGARGAIVPKFIFPDPPVFGFALEAIGVDTIYVDVVVVAAPVKEGVRERGCVPPEPSGTGLQVLEIWRW
jgi:hypothetical protein